MWNPRSLSLAIMSLAAVVFSAQVASAQQKVPFDPRFNIPVAPTGLAHRPLPDHPMEFDTAEGQKIRVVVVTKALEYPWSAAFLPDGSMLVTERPGRLRIIRNGVLDPKPVAGGPASYWAIESGAPGAVHGYMDIALHPKFADNHFVYLTYTKPLDDKSGPQPSPAGAGMVAGSPKSRTSSLSMKPALRALPSVATACST